MTVPFGVIFDLNGVIVDDVPCHIKAWQLFCAKYGVTLTEEEFKKNINGRKNEEIFPLVFGKKLSSSENAAYAEEKEACYRELFAEHRKTLAGFDRFIKELKCAHISTAIATGAPPINVSFILDYLDLNQYFDAIVDAQQVTKGKPDPEVYLMAASRINMLPGRCVVFEDGIVGLQAAHAAGMKPIGVATSLTEKELKPSVLVIKDFQEMTVEFLELRVFSLAG